MHQLEDLSFPLASRQEIAAQFWDSCLDTNPSISGLEDSYFAYFEKQCRLARQHDDDETPLCTQQNICDIVRRLKAGEGRETIRDALALKIGDGLTIQEPDVKPYHYAIDLTVRLWLMVQVGKLPRGVTGQTAITWQHGALEPLLAAHFHHELILTDQVKLEKVFNAMNIERIADVDIRWTPNLVDHLRFIEDGKKPVLNIFHHAAFLKLQRNNSIFPPGLIEETLQTLALLLPAHDQDCKKWFQKKHAKLCLDPTAITYGQLKLDDRQIARFKYWHDRLVVVKQFFDESKPRTFKQWWFDDRKRVQWFWVAILLVVSTILFGIIQCIEGGWQIWKAYHS